MPELSSPKRLRLFVALWPEPGIQAGLAAWQQAWQWPPRAALVKTERLHATLHFLGDVDAGRLPALLVGLRVRFEPFELALGRAEVWPGGIAVVRPLEVPAALLQLHADLAQALRRLDIPVEARPFRAHITLARRAVGAKPPAQALDLPWRAGQAYVLVRSLPGGAGYQVLERFA
jgi:2'-5' RNA ligase